MELWETYDNAPNYIGVKTVESNQQVCRIPMSAYDKMRAKLIANAPAFYNYVQVQAQGEDGDPAAKELLASLE